ncbi:MAG: ROK family protein [Prevotella sp.]|nr:ROK family protein [Prevotella sp.]
MNGKVKTRVVGIDVGVTYTTYAVVDIRGTIIAKERMLTTDYPDVNDFVSALSEKIVMLVEENGGYENIRSVGMGAPSANFLTGCIENASNMPWKGIVPLAAMLRDRLGLAVALGNDAQVTALGERLYGSAHGMKDFVVISLGHGGVGSCFYSGGMPHLGDLGLAGEIGHICVEENGRQCGCGRKGCLEGYASDRGIAMTAREVMAESQQPSMLRNLQQLTPEAIGECCDQGDELAREVYRRTGEMLGIGLSFYASVTNPEAIILTGSLTSVWQWLEEPTKQSFAEHVFPNIRNKCDIMVSILADADRDVIGAGALAWEVKEYSLFL